MGKKKIRDPTKEEIDRVLREKGIKEKPDDGYLDLTAYPKTSQEEENIDIIRSKPQVNNQEKKDEFLHRGSLSGDTKQDRGSTIHDIHDTIPVPVDNHPDTPRGKSSSKNLLIILSIFLGITIIIFLASIYISNNKDFNPTVNVESPTITPLNTYNHTIINNQTINVFLDEDFAEMIANQTIAEVKKQLNATNSS